MTPGWVARLFKPNFELEIFRDVAQVGNLRYRRLPVGRVGRGVDA